LTFSGNNIFAAGVPNLKPGYVQSWSFGIQRELNNDTAIEVRYMGNRGTSLWRGINLNEVNIFENGFLQEFQKAKQMLDLNVAGGCGNTFSPTTACNTAGIALPILTQAFNGTGTGLAALAASSAFGSQTFRDLLNQGQAGSFANTLAGNSTYTCRLFGRPFPGCESRGATVGPGALGLPINFFQANPHVAGGGAWVLTNGSWSTYHGMVVEFRRRMSKGLMLTANYTWSHGLTTFYSDSSNSGVTFSTLRDPDYSKSPSPFDIRHTARIYWSYEFPFGPGKRWSTGSGIVNRVIGGWQFLGVVAIQSGRNFLLTSGRGPFNQFEGGIVLNGITVQQIQSAIGVFPGPNTNNVYFINPSLIAANGAADPTRFLPPTAPGVLGQRVFLTGPNFVKPDFTLAKITPITERISTELRVEVFNAFNYKNIGIGASGAVAPTVSILGTTFGQTSSFFNDTGNQDQGPRMLQLVLRVKF
jgi:hypothetical protein